MISEKKKKKHDRTGQVHAKFEALDDFAQKRVSGASLAWHKHKQWPFWILLDFPTHQSG